MIMELEWCMEYVSNGIVPNSANFVSRTFTDFRVYEKNVSIIVIK